MPIAAERGYLIPAIGQQYVTCAKRLKDSILSWHPDAHVTILTEDMLPYGNQQGFANDWQVFKASPYRQTIKLEADMILSSPVDHWWTLFEKRDVVVSQGCRTIYNKTSDCRFYRKIFDQNNLPDVYNAITYWRLSRLAQDFFDLIKNIFENWNQYKTLLKFPDEIPTTDVVYAVATQIIGVENVTLPRGTGPTIVHMKKHIQPIQTVDWTKELVWEHIDNQLRINTVTQHGLVHYYIKEWLNE